MHNVNIVQKKIGGVLLGFFHNDFFASKKKRCMSRKMLHDDILDELFVELDNFMATYSQLIFSAGGHWETIKNAQKTSACSNNNNEMEILPFVDDFMKMMEIWSSFGQIDFTAIFDGLFNWQRKVMKNKKDNIENQTVCIWLIGHLLMHILTNDFADENRLGDVCIEKNQAIFLIQICLQECNHEKLIIDRQPESSGFFHFKTPVLKPATTYVLVLQSNQLIYKKILGMLSIQHLELIRDEMASRLLDISTDHEREHFVKNFEDIQFGLSGKHQIRLSKIKSSNEIMSKVFKDSRGFLNILIPLLTLKKKPLLRRAVLHVIVSILNREIEFCSMSSLKMLYTMKNMEWDNVICELHSLSTKFCTKKEVSHQAWDLRVAVLCLAKNDIFMRYWKEDAQNLLRFYSSQKSISTLNCIKFLLENLLKHFALSDKLIPGDSELMDFIHNIQTWAFTTTKQKNIGIFKNSYLPILRNITQCIASYDMNYAIQSHVRQLILEGESIFDEKKLIGLESMLLIFQQVSSNIRDINGSGDRLEVMLDFVSFQKNKKCLSEIISHVLIECNTHFGSEMVVSSSSNISIHSDYKMELGIETYYASLSCITHLYDVLEFNNDQIMTILAQSAIHVNSKIRDLSGIILKNIAYMNTEELSNVSKGIRRYILLLCDTEIDAFQILLSLLNEILSNLPCAIINERLKSPINEVQSTCCYLLCSSSICIRKESLQLLVVCRNLLHDKNIPRKEDATIDCVFDVIESFQSDFLGYFCKNFQNEQEIQDLGGIIWWLVDDRNSATNTVGPHRSSNIEDISQNDINSSFRWSTILAMIFPKIAAILPNVVLNIWKDINAKSYKLEPVIPTIGSIENSCEIAKICQWRNLAIFSCSTVDLVSQAESGISEPDISAEQRTSSVELLLKRLCRFIQSPSLEQIRAAVIALGSSHPSIHHLALKLLGKCSEECFEGFMNEKLSFGDLNGINHSSGKQPPSKCTKKLTTQDPVVQVYKSWAIVRCYRCLLEHFDSKLWKNPAIRAQILRLVEKTHQFLKEHQICNKRSCNEFDSQFYEQGTESASENSMFYKYMMQKDFCALIEFVEYQDSRCITTNSEDCINKTQNLLNIINNTTRSGWFNTLHSWSIGFISFLLVDSNNISKYFSPIEKWSKVGSINQKWIYCQQHCWSDDLEFDHYFFTKAINFDQAIFYGKYHYFLSKATFSAISSMFNHHSMDEDVEKYSTAFQWIDDAFSITPDSKSCFKAMILSLKQSAQSGLKGLIINNTNCIVNCIEKCIFYNQGSRQHHIALNYFHVIAEVVELLFDSILSNGLLVNLLHISLLHLGQGDQSSFDYNASSTVDACIVLNVVKEYYRSEKIISPTAHLISKISMERMSAYQFEIASFRQVFYSTAISKIVPEFSIDVLLTIGAHINPSSILLKKKLLKIMQPWVRVIQLNSLDEKANIKLLNMLFRITKKMIFDVQAELEMIWKEIALHYLDIDKNLDRIIAFMFKKMQYDGIDSCKIILWWIITNAVNRFNLVVDSILNYIDNSKKQPSGESASDCGKGGILQTIALGIFLLTDLTKDSSMSIFNIQQSFMKILHHIFLLLQCSTNNMIFGVRQRTQLLTEDNNADSMPVILSEDIQDHCLTLLSNLMSLKGVDKKLNQEIQSKIETLYTSLKANAHEAIAYDICKKSNILIANFVSTAIPLIGHLCTEEENALWSTECKLFLHNIDLEGDDESRLCVQITMSIYKLLSPSFDAEICNHLLKLLHSSLNGSHASKLLISEMLDTLKMIVQIMPSSKLILFPQMLWVCIALLNHSQSNDNYVEILSLLGEIIQKPSFNEPLLQDAFFSWRPTQWDIETASLQRAILNGFYQPRTNQLSVNLLHQLLFLPSCNIVYDSPLKVAVQTISLLPWVCAQIATVENSDIADISIALNTHNNSNLLPKVVFDLGYLWHLKGNLELSSLFFDLSSYKTSNSFLNKFFSSFSPTLHAVGIMKADGVILKLLLEQIRCNCEFLVHPALLCLEKFLHFSRRSSPIFSSKSDLIGSLMRILRNSKTDKDTRRLVLKCVSTATRMSQDLVPHSSARNACNSYLGSLSSKEKYPHTLKNPNCLHSSTPEVVEHGKVNFSEVNY